jgi:Domain of unknown function (DUF4288)
MKISAIMKSVEIMEILNEDSVSEVKATSENIYYLAHVIFWVRYKEGTQDDYPVWENIYLIKAKDSDEAWEKAEREGRNYSSPNEGLIVDRRSAEWTYGGVRKVIHALYGDFIRVDMDEFLDDVAELTWNEFTVPDKQSLDKLIAGEPVNVNYDE